MADAVGSTGDVEQRRRQSDGALCGGTGRSRNWSTHERRPSPSRATSLLRHALQRRCAPPRSASRPDNSNDHQPGFLPAGNSSDSFLPFHVSGGGDNGDESAAAKAETTEVERPDGPWVVVVDTEVEIAVHEAWYRKRNFGYGTDPCGSQAWVLTVASLVGV